ncbi:MAG: hypothetical protein HYZ07_02010, partial [Candidatus Harrisonbacteria bacterium]|nr:hypothetical protein [Candidatus Harrisonbacteria bacterium]
MYMTSGLQKQQIAGIMGGVAVLFAAALFLGINNAPASAQAESSQCVHVLPGTVSLWPAVDPLDAAQPILTDTFDDGIISPPWEVFDNITPSGGTFSASETNGKLTFSVSGGINFQQNAGVAYSVSSAPSEFSVSAAVAANFGGSSGNKRGQLVVRDAAGNVATLQLGDDGGSSFKWQAFSSASSAFGGYGNYTDG